MGVFMFVGIGRCCVVVVVLEDCYVGVCVVIGYLGLVVL